MQSFIGAKVLPEIVYCRPTNLEGALSIMRGEAPWTVMAGGTDFIPCVRKGAWSYPDGIRVIDIRKLEGFQGITHEDGAIRIGAATRLADVIRSPVIGQHAPVLVEAVQEMASLQVRNTATLGGNLCTASPAADAAPPLLALEATVEMVDTHGAATILPLHEFFVGPGQTRCRSGKLLRSIRFPLPAANDHTYWRKMGCRRAFTISVITMAMKARMRDGICQDIFMAFGAVAPTPLRVQKTELILRGQKLTESLIKRAADEATREVSPISDLRASAEYRRDMAGVLVKRALQGLL